MESEKNSSTSDLKGNKTKKVMTPLSSKSFQKFFSDAIEVKRSWEDLLPFQILDETLDEDRKLYKDEKIFLDRRNSAKMLTNSKQWSELITNAFWEIVNDREENAVCEIRRLGLYNSLYDFVDHINYFEIVRKIMEERGEMVYTFGHNHSSVHDIDKLHPVMLVAFSEKFDDNKDTLLWNISLKNHIDINPHHQGHSLWKEKSNCSDELRNVAIGEMICDKVSRRLQKNLKGEVDEDMWNVDPKFFDGLPPAWLSKAIQILSNLKHSK